MKIKGMLAGLVLFFGLGTNIVAAQELIKGPKDFETMVIQHGAICSRATDMKEFVDETYSPIFSGLNDIASLSKDPKKPTTSRAEVLYSDKHKSTIIIIYDWKLNTACIVSGIKDTIVNERGINEALGYKN